MEASGNHTYNVHKIYFPHVIYKACVMRGWGVCSIGYIFYEAYFPLSHDTAFFRNSAFCPRYCAQTVPTNIVENLHTILKGRSIMNWGEEYKLREKNKL